MKFWMCQYNYVSLLSKSKTMKAFDIIELAKSFGFVANHFLRLKDLKSGVVIAGVFTKYKQHETNGLRLKGNMFEVEVITDGKPNFEVLQSNQVNPVTSNEQHGAALSTAIDVLTQDHPEFDEEHTTGWDMMESLKNLSKII